YAGRGVRLHAAGTPSRLRVRARRTAPDTWSVVYTGTDGAPVLSIDGLTVREAPVTTEPPALFQQNWTEVTVPETGEGTHTVVPNTWLAVGATGPEGMTRYPDIARLRAAVSRRQPAPA